MLKNIRHSSYAWNTLGRCGGQNEGSPSKNYAETDDKRCTAISNYDFQITIFI